MPCCTALIGRPPYHDTAWKFSCWGTNFPLGWKQPVANQDLHPQALPQQHHTFADTAQIPPELGEPVLAASARQLARLLWQMPMETGQDKLPCAPPTPKATRWWTTPSPSKLLSSVQRYRTRRRKQCLWESACWNGARTLVHSMGELAWGIKLVTISQPCFPNMF